MRFTAILRARRAFRPTALLGAVAVGACVLALPGPAAAQWWNPFDSGPVYLDPPVYEEPPVYREPPPVYREPPPAYRAPDTGFIPDPDYTNRPGWREGRRPVPPADLLYEDDLEPRSEPRGYSNRRDGDRRLQPDEDWYEDRDSAAVPDPYGMEAYDDPYASDPYGQDPYGQDPYGAAPDTRSAPPADGWGGVERTRRAYSAEALDALSVYGPAKRAAVAVADAFARTTALRQVNTYLISQSARPATAETIRVIDRLLGIDVTDPATTALPPAGTPVERPKDGKSETATEDGIDRIADYANAKADALDRDGPDGVDVRAAETRLAEGLEGGLDAQAIVGLDAYLGLGEDAALVQAPGAAPDTGDERLTR